MGTIKVKETKEKNWTDLGVKLTKEEFNTGIHKAEEGPFYTFEELQATRKKWRNETKRTASYPCVSPRLNTTL